ncbi:MAG: protein translocase subunit SecF, partial [Pseudomonadota bacterium]
MQLISKQTNIDFMGHRRVALIVSLLLIAVSIGSLAIRGLNFGLDFTGGTLIELGYAQPVDLAEVRESLGAEGFDDAVVQTFGSAREIVVRLASRGEEANAGISTGVLAALEDPENPPEMRRVEFVGPQVGAELAEKGGLAMLAALAMILFYIIVRFQWK